MASHLSQVEPSMLISVSKGQVKFMLLYCVPSVYMGHANCSSAVFGLQVEPRTINNEVNTWPGSANTRLSTFTCHEWPCWPSSAAWTATARQCCQTRA